MPSIKIYTPMGAIKVLITIVQDFASFKKSDPEAYGQFVGQLQIAVLYI